MELCMNYPAFWDMNNLDRHIANLKAMDIKIVRLDLHPWHLNPEEGVYNLAELKIIMAKLKAAGIKVLLYFVGSPTWNSSGPTWATTDTYAPRKFDDWCSSVAYIMQQFPEVEYCQVWNEQNTRGFWKPWPSPQDYVGLVQMMRATLDVTPGLEHIKIVSGGHAYLGEIDNTGANMMRDIHEIMPLPDLFDVVCYHPYPDPHNLWTEGEGEVFARCREMNKWLRSVGVKEIWATEIGKSTYPGPEVFQPLVSEEQQAEFWKHALDELRISDFDKVFAFCWMDRQPWSVPDRDAFYGFYRVDGTEKPACDVLRRFCKNNLQNCV